MTRSPRLTRRVLSWATLCTASLPSVLAHASPPEEEHRLSVVHEGLIQTGASTVGAAGVGALLGLTGAIAGFILGNDNIITPQITCGDSCKAGFVGLTLGASLGGALSTQLVGRLNNSQGKFAPTLLGSTLGAGMGLGVSAAIKRIKPKGNLEREVVLFLGTSIGASLGSVLGYQLSARRALSDVDTSHNLDASQLQFHLNF